MFSRKTLSGIGLFIIVIVALMAAGCSDDSTPVSNTVAGSLTDPEFVPVKTQVDNLLDSTVSYLSDGFDNIYNLPVDTGSIGAVYGPMGANDTAIYVYANGWHIIYLAQSNAYFTRHISDSVQYMLDNVPLQTAGGLDYLHYIHRWDFATQNLLTTHTNMTGDVNLEFSGLDGTVAGVNGVKNFVVEWNYIGLDSTVEALYDMNVTAGDIQINKTAASGWASGCPSSGSLDININESWTLTDNTGKNMVVRTWKAAVQFINGTANVTITRLGTTWHYSLELCTPPSN